MKKIFLKISQNSQENTCTRASFFKKVAGLRPATLLQKRLWYRCFPMNFEKFLRTPFFIEHLWRLLLFLYQQLSKYKKLMNQKLQLNRGNHLYCLGKHCLYMVFIKNPACCLKIKFKISKDK